MSATTDQETNRRMYMKCKVCGAESGKYPLCINCNKKKEQGQIIVAGNAKRKKTTRKTQKISKK